MKSPLMKFSCGCVGISLDRKSKNKTDHTDIWLFYACDADDDMILGVTRAMSNDKVATAQPLSEIEFSMYQKKTQQQLQAGASMFDVVMNMERGKDYFRNFHDSVKEV